METNTKLQEIVLEEQPLVEEKKKKRDLYPYLLTLCLLITLIVGVFIGRALRPASEAKSAFTPLVTEEKSDLPSFIIPALLELDGESRTGEKLSAVSAIAVHYVANPGTSAMANRNYFNGPDSDSSAHFIVGLSGEVLLCVPPDEVSHATNERNFDTLSVEVCHPDETGAFSEESYESLIRLLAFLCDRYGLKEDQIIRHYDVTGKMCPLYYVEHPEAWEGLKEDVKEEREREDE